MEVPLQGHRIRVLVSDNTHIHTQLLANALKCDAGFEIISCNPNSSALLAVDIRRADVLLISSTLEEEPKRGLAVLRELRTCCPDLRAVVLLDSSKDDVILDAFRAGARGVFRRHESVETLRKCVRCVHQGQIWANSEEMSLALKALAASPTVHAVNANGRALLSKREMDVVKSLAEGLTNQEIAQRLGLSQHTVKNYLFRVFDKLGVSNRIELLFMTLSQQGKVAAASSDSVEPAPRRTPWDGESLAQCEKAATEGELAAQVALAQKTSSENPVTAYAWYLIASEQIAKVRKDMHQHMTPAQIVEAERRAAAWHKSSRKKSVAPAEPVEHRFAASAMASYD